MLFLQATLKREDGTVTDLVYYCFYENNCHQSILYLCAILCPCQVEVTSSGLTHTCADSRMNSFLCPLMMKLFSSHRLTAESFYIGKNFGSISVIQPSRSNRNNDSSCSSENDATTTCRDVSSTSSSSSSSGSGETAAKVLRVSIQSIDGLGSRRRKTPSTNFETESVLSYDLTLPGGIISTRSRVVDYEFADFYTIPIPYLAMLAAILLILVSSTYRRYSSKRKAIL